MIELHNFDLNLLVAFDLLMEEKNVSRAAERMFVTQSAMSHTLQRLRQQLDDPLLVKTPTGMKPTERALSLVEPVKAVLREIKRLIRAPEEFAPSQSRRRFVIAATDYMDYLVIPPLIERIAGVAPGVDVQVKRTELPFPELELEHNDLDVGTGFRYDPQASRLFEQSEALRRPHLLRGWQEACERQSGAAEAGGIPLAQAHADLPHRLTRWIDR